MPFIIGTAGHIDHGKTTLVKALTGQDTDRLKEEKERGISIDLGFAHLDLPDGMRAGVIDVPGHERFIRNMLAGAHGIDLVLFTVAADDGVMPQTIEHLDILHLLGVNRALFVVTKTDLVSPTRVVDVEEEIRILAAGTSLDDAPVVRVSSATGEGLGALRLEIARLLHDTEKLPPPGLFRLPVDRVFVLQGHGVVATGTALQGEISVGDRLRCLPGDQTFRVRSLQVHGESVTSACWGQRVALNLAGTETPAIVRGHVLCHEALTEVSDRFDATFEIRPSASSNVKSHQHVRVHLGTAERLGKIVLLGARQLAAPGQRGYCQVVMSAPLAVVRGGRFVIRDETAQRTLGGGTVIDPWSRPHPRREPGLDERLLVLDTGSDAESSSVFIDAHEQFALPLTLISQFLNVRTEDALTVARSAPTIRPINLDGDSLFTTDRKWNEFTGALLSSLGEFHAAHPLEPGRDMEELREKLPGGVTPRVFRAIVAQLEVEHVVEREGSRLRLPGHKVTLPGDGQRTAERITALLAVSPLSPPALADIQRETEIGRTELVQVLRVLEREGSIVRVSDDLYFLREAIHTVTTALQSTLSERDTITPAMFRDRFNTTRKYAIPLLEYLDREGVTTRIGDSRRLKARRTSA